MPIDRQDDDERKARIAALIEQGRALRARAEHARQKACHLIAESNALVARQERQAQRDALLRRATEALRIAKASEPTILPFRERRQKKRA